jgi:hypothetical protein
MDIDPEVATNVGRIDAVLDAGEHIYIFEFKFEKTADEALDQIERKNMLKNI